MAIIAPTDPSMKSAVSTTAAPRSASPMRAARRRGNTAAFTLVEVIVAVGIVAIGFLGAFAMILQSGRLVSAAEEDALVSSGIEQRMDQLRELSWPTLTDGTGITGTVWTARPLTMSGITVTQETITISAWDLNNAKTLNATWTGTGTPTATLSAGAVDLSTASAVKVVASLTWTGRRSSNPQTRNLVTVISRGGISKSALP
jgi:Tfp pilus assembly protein PilV